MDATGGSVSQETMPSPPGAADPVGGQVGQVGAQPAHAATGGGNASTTGSPAAQAQEPAYGRPWPSGQTEGEGWVIFAGIVLVAAGIMRFFDAIWAFHYHGLVPEGLQAGIFGHSLSTYGWLYLVVAIILFVCGFAVMVGSQVGRWVGVMAGIIGTVSAIWWMPYFPVWSLTYVVLGVLVVYALLAHGERLPA